MVDGDPKAFHWDAERNQALLPYSGTCWEICDESTYGRNGVLIVKVTPDGIAEVGRIDHADQTPSIQPPVETTTSTTIVDSTTTTEAAPTTT